MLTARTRTKAQANLTYLVSTGFRTKDKLLIATPPRIITLQSLRITNPAPRPKTTLGSDTSRDLRWSHARQRGMAIHERV
jgi:hypothetical protein